MNIAFFVVSLSLFIFLTIFLWMKWRMKASKGYFALSILSTQFSCLVFGVLSMSTSLPSVILSKISEALGYGTLKTNPPTYAILILTSLITYFIYKFGKEAIKRWDVPPRVSEIDLAEKHLENSIYALSAEKIKLLIKRQKDPIASDAMANWKGKITTPPKPIETKDLLKDMLVSAIREIQIPDNEWRDDGKVWIGEKLGLNHKQKKTVLALVFDSVPSIEEIDTRLKKLQHTSEKINDCQIFAIYLTATKEEENRILTVLECNVTVLSSRVMILMGLDLVSYAKELITSFENTRVGGTNATLSNSYVDLYVKKSNKDSELKCLNNSIDGWLQEKSNCHLAITGEYGQGKSTALMKFCVDWAKRFLETGSIGERVPLLIELRGQNPSESDPLGFISTWCARYRLLPQQVFNLIKSGDAILIFEGFDELRNAGKSYFRHQHFNALWRFAYPNTKLIFTGRPNFFLDEEEANRTLRKESNRETGGDYYSEVWELQKLDKEQIKLACRSYESSIRSGIISSIESSKDFLEIVNRPSMLPVVATIWPEIEKLQENGQELTGAELIERYIQAIFSRKEAELERDRIKLDAPSGSRYLLLPKQLRELLTICVAWRMSGLKYRNTIPRSEINEMVFEIYETVINISKSVGVSSCVAEGIIDFEKRYSGENIADKVEAITTEICSAGLLIPDAAGGSSNLRFPHKQFFEYLIAKAIKITSQTEVLGASQIILKSYSDSRIIHRLMNEPNSIIYLSECVGQDLSIFFTKTQILIMKLNMPIYLLNHRIKFLATNSVFHVLKIRKSEKAYSHLEKLLNTGEYFNSELDDMPKNHQLSMNKSFLLAAFGIMWGFFSVIILSGHNTILSEVVQSILIVFVFVCMWFPFLNQNNQNIVLIQFLKAHWKHVGQKPKNKSHAIKVALRAVWKGKVCFPDEEISQPSNFDQFLYPAKDFGYKEKKKL